MNDLAIQANSSWRDLSPPGTFATADAFIAHGEAAGHFPVSVESEPIQTVTGLAAPGEAIVCTYADGHRAARGVNGDRYRATDPEEWRELIRAARNAGAEPISSHRWKSTIAAMFRVGTSNGLQTNLILADDFAGRIKLTLGDSTVKLSCWNSLMTFLRRDGDRAAQLRHTSSLGIKIQALVASLGDALQHGADMRDAYHRAEAKLLSRSAAEHAFDLMFPHAADDAAPRAKTMAENLRAEARAAAALPINHAGTSLATPWNAATYLVDRRADGSPRPTRGGDAVASMIFGPRAVRIAEIQRIVEVMLADGSVEAMTVAEATAAGVSTGQIGSQLLEDMLAGA